MFPVRIDAEFAGLPPVRFAETTFNDAQQARSSTGVDVTLRQRRSADGFATPVTIGCQFVVESP